MRIPNGLGGMDNFKPMLADHLDYDKLKYPVMVTPKLDGIRCCVVNGKVLTRSLKPVPNYHIRKTMANLPDLDGELMVKGDFNEVQSAVMSELGKPDFTYNVFDTMINPRSTYTERMQYLRDMNKDLPDYVRLVIPELIPNEERLLRAHGEFLDLGMEGRMVRCPNGRYKYGRSTQKEGLLLKLKEMDDCEVTILSVKEMMRNTNESTLNELGYLKKSTEGASYLSTGIAAGFHVKLGELTFDVGFVKGVADNAERMAIWDNRDKFADQLATIEYQGKSAKGVPRFPRFKGLRSELDL